MSQFAYDGDGRRIRKTEWVDSLQDYQTYIYVYSGMEVVYEKNLDTGLEAYYICGQTGKIAKKVGELTDYYHADHLGSTRLITDESGNVVSEVSYEPFGKSTGTGEEDSYLFHEKPLGGWMYHLTLILDFSSNLWGKALNTCFSLVGLGFLHKAF